jgi:hypothetical protein
MRSLPLILALLAAPAVAQETTPAEIDAVCSQVGQNGFELMYHRQIGTPFELMQQTVDTFDGTFHDLLQAMLIEAWTFPDLADPQESASVIVEFADDSEAACRAAMIQTGAPA